MQNVSAVQMQQIEGGIDSGTQCGFAVGIAIGVTLFSYGALAGPAAEFAMIGCLAYATGS